MSRSQALLPRPGHRAALALAACALLALAPACAIQKAQAAYDQGNYEDALSMYQAILAKDPNDVRAKIGFRRTAPLAAEAHLIKARDAQKHGQVEVVQREVTAAVMLDPANAVARDWMSRLEEAELQRRSRAEEQSVEKARARAEAGRAPLINPRSIEGMDLNFTRKTSLKEIFQQLSRASGVNIILHSSVSSQDPLVSVDLRGLTFQRVLDTLMLQSDMFYKVLTPDTIMVFRRTPQNLMDYENKLIQTFYLSNAEVDNVRMIFNAILPQMRVFIDKRINAITVQARPNDLAIAQRIVGQLDKAKAEVMVYLELLEVNESTKEQLGLMPTMNLGDTTSDGLFRMGILPKGVGENGFVTTNGLPKLSARTTQFLFAPFALDMLKTMGGGKLLASPNVRVVSGETGEVNIGEKITTTQSSLGPAGANTTASAAAASGANVPGSLANIGGMYASQTSFSYEDVGVHIKVKPRVHFNNDVTIDLESTVRTRLPGGQTGRPDLGQRIIKTSARLHDGETAIFGGLLKEDEAKSLQGVWGITDLPIIGSLLGHTNKSKSRTDVILTLRAVVVRRPDLSESDFQPFDPDLAGGAARPFAPQGAAAPAPDAPAPGAKATPGTVPAAPPAGPGPAAAAESPLAFSLAPVLSAADKGGRVLLTLKAEGARGLTEGALGLKLDPRLKLVSAVPGSLLGAEGTLETFPAKDGGLDLIYSCPKGTPSGGALAVLELEAVGSGPAPVQLREGPQRAGANPLPAQFVNALVNVR